MQTEKETTSRTKKDTRTGTAGARTRTPAPKVHTTEEDKERSDWEGMTRKPEQPSDDIAAPGQLP